MFPSWAMVPFLDNREQAIAIWLVAVAVWVTVKDASVWRSAGGVLGTFFSTYKLPLLFGAAALYATAAVLVVRAVGIWDNAMIKPTVYAFLGTCVLVGRAVSTYDEPGSLRRMILRVFAVSIIIDFLVNLYVFPLYVELVLVPVVTLLVGMQVVVGRDPEQAQAKTVIEFLLAAIGVTLLVYSLVHAAVRTDAFLTWENAASFFLVPAMTVVFVPFFWVVMRASRWEQTRLRRWFQALAHSAPTAPSQAAHPSPAFGTSLGTTADMELGLSRGMPRRPA